MRFSRFYLLAALVAVSMLLVACSTPTEETPVVEDTQPAADEEQPSAEEEAVEPTDTPAPTVAEASPTANLIVFTSNRGDDPNAFNLYLINPASGEISQLTDSFAFTGLPTWSPSKDRVAFFTNDDGTFRVHVVGADGQGLQQITDFSSAVPDWFPNGERLVFNSDHQSEPTDVPDIYAMNLDGSDLLQIIDADSTADFQGKISPDGSQILFVSDRGGNQDLYLAALDGSNVTQLTDDPANDYSGNWSPDGSQIVFVSERGEGTPNIWLMNADGSEQTPLTTEVGIDLRPSWSPDGSQIIFDSGRSGAPDLWIINSDGSNLTQLTDDDFVNLYPDW